ncbi:BTAD domain-containing putative transcriptional regulator [Actinosynnema sp. NPDC050801]|uniref:BTAD domain-containing putative transcriptional regulator n=1 Tax=unclassified Actinosynnema TaxID=2637065 RepID=UPI0033F04B1B
MGAGEFGERVRARRRERGLTQEDVAAATGLSVRTLRDVEAGRVRSPRGSSLARLTAVLELDGTGVPEAVDVGWRVGVLGVLTVHRDGVAVELPQLKLRHLVARLALSSGRPVPVQDIVEVLWPGGAPSDATGLVQTYVSRLRRVLGGTTNPVVAEGAGYRLATGDMVDAARFVVLVRSAGEHDDRLTGLLVALGLWRGPVVADLPGLSGHPAAVHLSHSRVATAIEAAGLARAAGRVGDIVPVLTELATGDPFDEAVHAELLLALAAVGRRGEALRLFVDVRRRLTDQLGVAPSARLRAAHMTVLGDGDAAEGVATRDVAAPRAVTPAQLPPDVVGFSGRDEVLAELDVLLEDNQVGLLSSSAVTGAPGIGKTAVAVRWAHRNRHRFPDGQLHVRLRGFAAQEPLTPLSALTQMLPALGVEPGAVPDQEDAAAALYRSLLADRRMLVVLDDAADADQVRPLLPAGAHCRVLITSRDRLSDLVALDGARRVVLDVLTDAEARALLVAVLGKRRVAAEEAAAAELALLCGYLPLALRIAGANLLDTGGGIAELVERLAATGRVSGLRVDGGNVGVDATFSLSYKALGATERRLFALLGVAPATDLSLPALTALSGLTQDRVADALATLLSAHLVDERVTGRFAMHDLLREYAVGRAAEDLGENEVRLAHLRLARWCLAATRAATDLTFPQFGKLPQDDDVPEAVVFADTAAAWRWLDAEHATVLAVLDHAVAAGIPAFAWLLTDALHGYLGHRVPTTAWRTAVTAALAAAEAHGDDVARAAMWRNNGNRHLTRGEYDEAIDQYQRALVVFERLGRAEDMMPMLANIGMVHAEHGRLADAEIAMRKALALTDRAAPTARLGVLLSNLAILLDADNLARLPESAALAGEAVVVYRDLGEPRGELQSAAALLLARNAMGRTGGNRALLKRMTELLDDIDGHTDDDIVLNAHATACFALGRTSDAARYARAALDAAERTGSDTSVIVAGNTLGRVLASTGEIAAAERLFTTQLAAAERMDFRGEAIAARLGLGELALAAGQPARARELLDPVPGLAERAEMPARHAYARLALARACGAGTKQAAAHATIAAALFRRCGIRLAAGDVDFLRSVAR